jgi:hypothetical protein
MSLKVSVVPVAAKRLGAARLGYSLTADVACGKSVQIESNIESVVMTSMVHEIRVAIQRREHQTIRRLKILEDRRGDGQALSHVIATRCEEATAEIITVLKVGRRIIHVRRCE